ncbi:MAG TPA: NAD(P)H-dependent oxidoreductase, partial [Blastocatellia bacterium]|nr:NAD(P)H-dependent oxidoreductase [Blastocatellia bacterium]
HYLVAKTAFAHTAIDQRQFEVSVIDPRTFYQPLVSGSANHPALHPLFELIGEADGFLVVTPEYNHSYPAALKLVIDAVKEQWQAKPVAFVSYGGVSGGLRAVEHLRQVFAELHAVSVRETVSFSNVWEQFSGNAKPVASASRSIARMLARLKWWASALRTARAATPFMESPA